MKWVDPSEFGWVIKKIKHKNIIDETKELDPSGSTVEVII